MTAARTPTEERALQFYIARVYLREARARRARDPRFAATLVQWAGNARRRATAIVLHPTQRAFDL